MSLHRLSSPRLLRALAASAAAVLLAACGDITNATAISGTFNLQSVDGAGVPAIIHSGTDGTLRVANGVLQLTGDERFTGSLTYIITPSSGAPSTAPFILSGSFRRSGSTVQFYADNSSDFDDFTGTLSSDNRLSIDVEVLDDDNTPDRLVFVR